MKYQPHTNWAMERPALVAAAIGVVEMGLRRANAAAQAQIAVVNGHQLRWVETMLGPMIAVDGFRSRFVTIEAAQAFARALRKGGV